MVSLPRQAGAKPDWRRLAVGLVPAAVVAAIVIAGIAPGLAPDVAFWDTGEFQTVLPILGTAHPTGYPTYVILGFLVNLLLTPLGEPAFRMNVLSLLCVAAAAAVTVRIVVRLTASVPVAVAAGLGLAFTPDVWRIATHADPHTLHLAFVAVVFALLLRWEHARRGGEPAADRWLVAAAVAFALAAGNHSLTLLLALPIGLYVLSVHPGIVIHPRLLAICALAVAIPLVLVYLELPLRAGPFRAPLVYARPDTWSGFLYVVMADQFRGSVVDPLGNLAGKLGDLVDLTVSQYGFVALLVPLGFLATLVREPRFALLTGSAMLITVLFNASYVNADINRYYLGPILWAWLWIAVLAGAIAEQFTTLGERDGRDAPEGPAVPGDGPEAGHDRDSSGSRSPLAVAVGAVLAVAILAPTILAYPQRAEAADQHADTIAREWVTAVLREVQPNAVVVSWWSTSTVLWYATLVDHERPDITIIDDRTRLDLGYGEATDVIARFYGSRPVYVIRANDADLNKVIALYDLAPLATPPATNVYRVIRPWGPGE